MTPYIPNEHVEALLRLLNKKQKGRCTAREAEALQCTIAAIEEEKKGPLYRCWISVNKDSSNA